MSWCGMSRNSKPTISYYRVCIAFHVTGLIHVLVRMMALCLLTNPSVKHAPVVIANAACIAVKPALIKILVPITARLKRFAISTHY